MARDRVVFVLDANVLIDPALTYYAFDLARGSGNDTPASIDWWADMTMRSILRRGSGNSW